MTQCRIVYDGRYGMWRAQRKCWLFWYYVSGSMGDSVQRVEEKLRLADEKHAHPREA